MKPSQWRDAVRDSGLDRTCKLVAHTLSTYMNASGSAFPGKELLAKGASLNSPRTVDEAVNRLEAAGYITVLRSKGRRPNRYMAATPYAVAGSTPHSDAGSMNGNPASDHDQPRSAAHPTPHGGAPESEEQSERKRLLLGGRARALTSAPNPGR